MWSASSRTVISTASRRDEALLHQVLEAAGAGDDDVDAGLERRDLAVLRDAAEDGGDLQAVGVGQRLEAAVIWVASSRVGARTRPSGRPGRRLPPASLPPRRATMGMENARVLPRAGLAAAEHVAAGERVGQGVDLDGERRGRLPSAASAATRGAGTPRAAKVFRHVGGAFRASGCAGDRTGELLFRASVSTSLARLPVGKIDRRKKSLCWMAPINGSSGVHTSTVMR